MLNAIKNATTKKSINIIVSKHLQKLHEALNLNIPNNFQINFKDFKIKNGILGIFTNKYFFSFQSINEILSIKKYFEKEKSKPIYLEHKKRAYILNLFTKFNANGVYEKGSVYNCFNSIFESTNSSVSDSRRTLVTNLNVVIFPDSRKISKQIDSNTLNNLSQILGNKKVCFSIAKYNSSSLNEANNNTTIRYHNFQELVALIKNADFIISSDSLPVHIAEILNKPHWILYNKKINTNWLTPSSMRNKQYCTFDEVQLINNLFN
jgi:ADP-heptose:LPS heptosyltransferase